MTFYQWLKDKLARGEKPTYIAENVNKPAKADSLKLRGVGWTRKDKSRSKKKRKLAQASKRRNRK